MFGHQLINCEHCVLTGSPCEHVTLSPGRESARQSCGTRWDPGLTQTAATWISTVDLLVPVTPVGVSQSSRCVLEQCLVWCAEREKLNCIGLSATMVPLKRMNLLQFQIIFYCAGMC